MRSEDKLTQQMARKRREWSVYRRRVVERLLQGALTYAAIRACSLPDEKYVEQQLGV